MRLKGRFFSVLMAIPSCILLFGSVGPANAQDKPVLAPPPGFHCTGYISEDLPSAKLQVVGGDRENMKLSFTERDVVFLNKGLEAGMREGAVYSIVRPMGEITQPFTKKKLGYYVKEVGTLKLTAVQGATSTAVITESCDTVWMSDVLVPVGENQVAGSNEGKPSAASTSDVLNGQIFMARAYHDYAATNDIVYVDIGTRQGAQPGDSFTIWRPLGQTEGLTNFRDDKVYVKRDRDFSSDRYHGGEYAIGAPRQSHEEVLQTRPTMPHKEVGKLVLLRVDGTTSVARIVSSREEINIGDHIERSVPESTSNSAGKE
jgi:hypothetical protein